MIRSFICNWLISISSKHSALSNKAHTMAADFELTCDSLQHNQRAQFKFIVATKKAYAIALKHSKRALFYAKCAKFIKG